MITLADICAAAAAEASKPKEGKRSFGYWFSNVGSPCLRRLVLDAMAEDSIEPQHEVRPLRHILTAACGTAVGDVIERGAKALGLGVQVRVERSEPVKITGALDIETPDTVIDLKLVGESKWKRVKKEPDRGHVLQVNGYAVERGRKRWALAYLRGASIFKPDNEMEWKVYADDADPVLADEVGQTWATVDAHRKAGTLPVIPPEFQQDRFPCGWKGGGCVHREECWK